MNSIQLLNTASDLTFYSEKFAPGSSEALEKAATFGLPFSLFGFATVFFVLAIIMTVIFTFGKVFGEKAPKAEKKTEAKQDVKISEPEKVVEVPVQTVSPASDDKGIIAAIIAAITSYRNASGEVGTFRVVSFKKRK